MSSAAPGPAAASPAIVAPSSSTGAIERAAHRLMLAGQADGETVLLTILRARMGLIEQLR